MQSPVSYTHLDVYKRQDNSLNLYAYKQQLLASYKPVPGKRGSIGIPVSYTHLTIASRCGVFAKSDVQPLINQGARTEDIAASIYKAVVNQTIAGLAQGRPIKGNILYLGGPLTFSTVLRKSFDEALNVTGTCPENSLLYVALGAALYADKEFVLTEVCLLYTSRCV